MIRTYAYFKIQNAAIPQPMVGSWVTAGLGLPLSGPQVLTLGTALSAGNDASVIFQAGDRALLIDPSGANAEPVPILNVLNNTVTIGATLNSHISGVFGTGTFIIPNDTANNFYLQSKDGNLGNLFLGTAFNMQTPAGAVPGFRMVAQLAKVAAGAQPVDFSDTMGFGANPFSMSEIWIMGTAADLYLPNFTVL